MGGEQDLNTYKNCFEDFKQYIKKIYNEPEPKRHEGYFVDYNAYIRFETFVSDLVNGKTIIPSLNYKEFIKSEKIRTINFERVKRKILKNDEFIIINRDLYSVICQENEFDKNNNKITYELTPTNLILFPESLSETIYRNNKNNIINKLSIRQKPGVNLQKINKIYKDIKHYYENEKEIINKLKEEFSTYNYYGYLVDKKWVDEWVQCSFYDSIKTIYFDNNIKDEYLIKDSILNQQLKSTFNYDNINNINNFILQHDTYLNKLQKGNNAYVLLDESFIKGFINIDYIKISNFILSFQKISIEFPNKYIYSFPTQNNIIQFGHNIINSNDNNNTYNSEILKHLLRFYYFKEEFKTDNDLKKIKKNEAYIIKSDVLNKLQRKYNIKEIYKFLYDYGQLNGITYHNFNLNYPTIWKYLNQTQNIYVQQIKALETSGLIQFTKNESEFIAKIFYEQPHLKYLDGFVLIDKEFASSLKNLFKESINILSINYLTYGDKMLLKIDFNHSYIYEIVKYNNKQNFEVIYLIEIIKKDRIDDIASLYRFIFYMNDIKNSVPIANPLIINKDFIINLHPVKLIIPINNKVKRASSFEKNNNDIISKIIKNQNFKKAIYLYCNELYFEQKLKHFYYKDEEFYLIKREHYLNIKTQINYDNIKNYLIGKINNIPSLSTELLYFLKALSSKDLNDLLNHLKTINEVQSLPVSFEIEKETIINPVETGESFTILKNFQLIKKSIMNFLFPNKNSFHILKCSCLGNNMFVFHYPINQLNNIKYILVVSIIDESKNIKNKYLLIYEKPEYISNHFDKKIRFNLNNYLSSLNFNNNITQIWDQDHNKLGLVIKFPIPRLFNNLKEAFSHKPLIGLEKIGDTCFINPVLQCLCNIERFANYFKYDKDLDKLVKLDNNNNEKLSSEFKLLLENLYPNQQSRNYEQNSLNNWHNYNIQRNFYSAKKFKDKFVRMQSLLENRSYNISNDFINFIVMILDTLHKELNVIQNNQDNFDVSLLMDKSNKKLVYNNFKEKFKKKHCSIISELFYAVNCNVTQCTNCKVKLYDYQNYFFLSFNMEEVKEYKLNNNSGIIDSNMSNTINIYDCFSNNRKEIELNGDDAIDCMNCKNKSKGKIYTTLTTGPEILIIILDRGKRGQETNIKIEFYQELHLNNYIELGSTGCHYELIGVISLENQGQLERYIAYCKSFFDNKWFKYNDRLVNPVNDVESEIFSNSIPYLLLFKKIQHK